MFLTFLNVFDFNMNFFNYIYGCSADNNVDYYCTLNGGRGGIRHGLLQSRTFRLTTNVVLDCFMRNGVLSGGNFFRRGRHCVGDFIPGQHALHAERDICYIYIYAENAVRPSVCMSSADIVSKQMNISSQ